MLTLSISLVKASYHSVLPLASSNFLACSTLVGISIQSLCVVILALAFTFEIVVPLVFRVQVTHHANAGLFSIPLVLEINSAALIFQKQPQRVFLIAQFYGGDDKNRDLLT